MQVPSDSEHESDVESVTKPKQLKLKVINHTKKSEYRVINIRNVENSDLRSFETLKELILANTPTDVPKPDADTLEFGFITPGHGLKGRKEWIFFCDEDVAEMLKAHKGSAIMLWCYSCKKEKQTRSPKSSCSKPKEKQSRSRSPNSSNNKYKHKAASLKSTAKTSRYESQMLKVSAFVNIYKRLDEKFIGKSTPEQLRAWAHMIELKPHDSYDEPPDKPFFVGKRESSTEAVSITPQKSSNSRSIGISPGKRINLRTECIGQVEKWHALLESGAITKDQYDEMQQMNFSGIKKF